MTVRVEIGRLAFRVEGGFWNAYWAPSQSSMDGAVLLGSIIFNSVENNKKMKDGFMELMKQTFSFASSQAIGQTPGWNDPVPAPEHERK